MMTVEVAARSTTWLTGEELDPAKVASPGYVATRLLVPGAAKPMSQLVAGRVTAHPFVPSLTVTVPVGSGGMAQDDVTATLTVTTCPMTDGSGTTDVIVVVESHRTSSVYASSLDIGKLVFESVARRVKG